MSFIRVVLAFALAFALLPLSVRAAPLEAYGKLPSIEAAAVSPSGRSIAYAVTNGEQRAIVVKDIASNQFLYRAIVSTAKVRGIQWADDRFLILLASVTASALDVIGPRQEFFGGFVLDLQTKRLSQMMDGAGRDAMNVIVSPPVVRTWQGHPTAFVQGIYFVGGTSRLSLFRVALDKSAARLVETGASDTRRWIVGADGDPVAQELYDGKSGVWTLRLKTPGGWRDADTVTAPTDPPYVIGLARDGRSVLYAVHGEKGAWSWREARPDGAPPGAPLAVRVGQDPILDPQDGRLIGQYALVGDESRYSFFDEVDNKVWNAVANAFPGEQVTLASWSRDHQKIIVFVDSRKDGPAYAFVDLATRRATWLGAQYQELKPDDISPWRAIRFKAADGLELSGYLTLPRGKPEKDLPLVVFPHGGPAARDTPGFDWWAQAMASRGYAVLQVNFRGSDGLGSSLLEAGYGQWGRKMQTDLSDGVRYLAKEGVIDPKRVCIVGGSYGGYAALAGAAFDPGVYRCAASVAGLSDLRRFVDWSKGRAGDPAQRYWSRFMGGEGGFADVSPAAHVDRIKIPILLVHGRDDTVVPLEQSRFMADALEHAGKPVEFVVLPGADHWLSRGDTRLQTLKAVVAFLEKNNPPN